MGYTSAFYKNAVPVDSKIHAGWSLEGADNYKSFNAINFAPLAAVEIPLAASSYPIAFSTVDGNVSPVVILSARNGDNIFVNKKGDWAADTYIPVYFRSYPFVVLAESDSAARVLCVDDTCERFNSENRGQLLFDAKGEQTEFLAGVHQFLFGFDEHAAFSKRFCDELVKLDLLEPIKVPFKTSDGSRPSYSELMVVSKEKLKLLDSALLGALAKNDFLELIYLHIHSMQHLEKVILVTRTSRRT